VTHSSRSRNQDRWEVVASRPSTLNPQPTTNQGL
jgi:hypothetical protein